MSSWSASVHSLVVGAKKSLTFFDRKEIILFFGKPLRSSHSIGHQTFGNRHYEDDGVIDKHQFATEGGFPDGTVFEVYFEIPVNAPYIVTAK